jgi:anaerobic ribonucleoside-triphosphate reductase
MKNKECEIFSFVIKKENKKKDNLTFNIEQIPGESMSVRLAKVDKLIFKEKNISWDIYANQFIPLWDTKSTIWERLKRDGEMNSLLTGGGICHINTGEEITSKQAQNIIQYSVSCGCEHFAITGTYCKCEDNHIFIGNKNKCSICGKSVIEKYARVVGFWTPVSSWSSTKQELDHNRRKEYSKENFEHGN